MDNLQELRRVGPIVEGKLIAAGYGSWAKITEATPETLSARVGVPLGTATSIIASAVELEPASTDAEVASDSGDGSEVLRQLAKAMLDDSDAIGAFAEAAAGELRSMLGNKLSRRVGKQALKKKAFGKDLIRALAKELARN